MIQGQKKAFSLQKPNPCESKEPLPLQQVLNCDSGTEKSTWASCNRFQSIRGQRGKGIHILFLGCLTKTSKSTFHMHLGPNHYVIAKREIANLIARPVQGELHWLTPQEWFVHSLPQEWSVHSRHRNDLSKTFNTCMAPSGNPLIYVRGINTQSKIRSRYGEDTKIRWARYGEQDKVSKIRWARYGEDTKIRSRYGQDTVV